MARPRSDRETREARERLRIYQARQSVHEGQRRRRRRDNILALVGVVILVGLAGTAQAVYFTQGPGKPKPSSSAAASATPTPTPSATTGQNVGSIPDPATAEDREWSGVLTINGIAMDYTVDGRTAPQAVAVWLQEVRQGYYDNKTCHRVVTGSLIQCGSEDGTGATEKDFSFGPIENAPASQDYAAGVIALARAGNDAYSQGHQFFIVTKETPLPNDSAGGYTVFGTITSNLGELATKIVNEGTSTAGGDGPPKVKTIIDAVTVAS